MKPIKLLSIVFFIAVFSQNLLAGGGHGHGHDDHGDHHEEEPKGPKGGKWLTQDQFGLEVIIFEQGVEPEMRIYLYDDHRLLATKDAEIIVTLGRLGGDKDLIKFIPEQDYWVGDAVIREPHSYDVTVQAKVNGKAYEWHYASYEGRVEISDRLIKKAGIKLEKAESGLITTKETLYGIIAPKQNSHADIAAPFPSIVKHILVSEGDELSPGQAVLTLKNTESQQTYTVNAPGKGVVTQIHAAIGQKVDTQILMEMMDLSSVWVELSAFPEAIEKLTKGQTVDVYDLHQHEKVQGNLIYIAPVMTGGHIARARAVIANADGHWRVGMHIKADVITQQKQVPIRIKRSAIQRFRGMPVVFAKFGNTFEVRMIEMANENQGTDYVEVTGGIKPGTDYVSENSYLIKADILKSGASHDH
ncbi:MAG: efflux RND transporter periplasmic adaptor subunit [Cellvibrionales bacterium]|nr:efflux RND transporter periplasmic adaptor subunit [Cellvibrionales bacterium]